MTGFLWLSMFYCLLTPFQLCYCVILTIHLLGIPWRTSGLNPDYLWIIFELVFLDYLKNKLLCFHSLESLYATICFWY